jgi:hypothetical protein
LITEEATNIDEKIRASSENQKIENIVKTSDFTMSIQIRKLYRKKQLTPATFTAWIYNIAKDSFGFIKVEQLTDKTDVLPRF